MIQSAKTKIKILRFSLFNRAALFDNLTTVQKKNSNSKSDPLRIDQAYKRAINNVYECGHTSLKAVFFSRSTQTNIHFWPIAGRIEAITFRGQRRRECYSNGKDI